MSYTSEVLADNPVAYYRMDEADGFPQDSSGNANHVTSEVENPPNAIFTYGAVGAIATDSSSTSIKFDRDGGAGSQFHVDDDVTLDLGNVFTMEFWVKLDLAATEMWPLSKGDVDAYEVRIQDDAKFNLTKISAYVVCESTVAIPRDGNFHHIVAVRPGTNQAVLYLDGIDVTGTVNSGSDFANNTDSLRIGSSGGQHFDGWLDEIALYGTALPQARIQAHYYAATNLVDVSPAPFRSGRGSAW